MHAALVRLGFFAQAATDIIGEQEIDTLEELRVLDDKEVECLCKVVRKPGGTSNAAGTAVSLRAEAGGNKAAMGRYYNFQEWKTMSPDKRKAVMALREKRGNVHKKARQVEEYQKIAAIVVASINAGQSKSAESENKALGRRNEQMACSSITTYDYNSTAINLHDTQENRTLLTLAKRG